MDEHEALEGDDPAAGFLHASGERRYEGFHVERGGSCPLVDPLEVLVIDRGVVVACRLYDDGLDVRIPVRGPPG